VLDDLGLTPGGYFVVSSHREENVDVPANLDRLLDALRALPREFGREVVVSVHPRTRRRLEGVDAVALDRVRLLKPLGFLDYVKLQRHAFCVLSDSGTLTEEAALLKFPAVMIREAHERPEGVDVGATVMAGLDPARIVDGVRVATEQAAAGFLCDDVADYAADRVSDKVVRIILGYAGYVDRSVWRR
jgi:UDP-N-acetylglucosamine 2-epimerase (non-hydrolysing)